MWRGGDIIRPLLESVEWCEPIGHRHALTRIHTAYSPALFDRLHVMSQCRINLLWTGRGDIIRPLLGIVEWYDPVDSARSPSGIGEENLPTARGCRVVRHHWWGCVVKLLQLGTLTHSQIHYTLIGAIQPIKCCSAVKPNQIPLMYSVLLKWSLQVMIPFPYEVQNVSKDMINKPMVGIYFNRKVFIVIKSKCVYITI